MIAILTTASASSYAPLVLSLNPDSNISDSPERVVRTPTIDGDVYLYSLGKSDGDRTFNVIASVPFSTVETLEEMRNLYNEFCLSLPDGVYKGMISNVGESSGFISISFLPSEKL